MDRGLDTLAVQKFFSFNFISSIFVFIDSIKQLAETKKWLNN